jgi:hypothetical protein
MREYDKGKKFTYYLWDVFIKNYVTFPRATRLECFPLLKKVFLNAFEAEIARKVILLAILSNHIASNGISAEKTDLQSLFEHCIADILGTDGVVIKYHYQCYLQIVANALSADLLTIDCLISIIEFSLKMSPQLLKYTTSLMLLYGAQLRQHQAAGGSLTPQQQVLVTDQRNYLYYLRR